MKDYSEQLTHAILQLSAEDSLRGLFHQHLEGNPLPSARTIREIVELTRSIIFPGYFGSSKINRNTVQYHIGVQVERLFDLLTDQISAALCFQSADNEAHTRTTVSSSSLYHSLRYPERKTEAARILTDEDLLDRGAGLSAVDAEVVAKSVAQNINQVSGIIQGADTDRVVDELALEGSLVDEVQEEQLEHAAQVVKAKSVQGPHEQGQQNLMVDDEIKEVAAQMAAQFVAVLSNLRSLLAMDVKACFDADPAATSFGEVICCYPGMRAISNYRIAHQLLMLGVPLIPRTITELAHSETGIDIHPGARIGSSFAIDHGTGVVIGETCIIGNNVELFQGVTLGAKTIPVDADGVPLNIPRHPILEDDVVVYANATILGRITIGKGSVIGGNVWVTEDIPAGSKIVQTRATR